MVGKLYYITLFLLCSSIISFGQISPGELSQAHADLEGISKCTSCHDLRKKVSDDKCMECHTDIKSLRNQRKGYHGNDKVINKSCIECHSDHNGRKFEMTRFDKDKFDHDQTGYPLEGKHKSIDCMECHTSDHISDPEIRKRKNTFLGLDEKCTTCHEDFHQGTLSKECVSCHNMEAFKPASKFDHNKAKFKLLGKHTEVDCKECHKITTRNGEKFQQFTNLTFTDCKSCHNDPHKNRIQGKCSQCHTETSFATFIGKGQFDHSVTNFTLKGEHLVTDCFKCHSRSSNPTYVFSDKKNIDEKNCIKCHEDVHNAKFGDDCAKCHKETGFRSLKSMDFFDHDKTDYPLIGKHLQVDCKKCHKGKFTDPVKFATCNNCHSDYHNGEFKKNENTPDCKECHSLQDGFEYSLYTIEKHNTTTFPLTGSHLATPCFACHVKQKKWTFVNMGTKCNDCHKDIHDGFISEKFYPGQNCESCHVNESWSQVSFDHNRTNWPLDGQHALVSCRKCHFTPSAGNTANNSIIQSFKNLNNNCWACHENIHGNQFAVNGVTDCARCHITESWFPEKFDHNTTNFPLEGKHAEIDCRECHIVNTGTKVTNISFKIEKFECIDCHQ